MATNRLSDLRRGRSDSYSNSGGSDGSDGDQSGSGDVEMTSGGGGGGEESEAMNEFFLGVNRIKADIQLVADNVAVIRKKGSAAITTVSADEDSRSNKELDVLLGETNRTINSIRNRLKEMEAENGSHRGANARVRENMHGVLSKKFVDTIKDYQEAQAAYRNKFRARMEKNYKIAHPKAEDDEIARFVERGDPQALYTEVILQETQEHAAAAHNLELIQERHQDIVALERSINELHQLFVDMALLVDQQSELLDQIEYSVTQAEEYTQSAVTNLERTNELAVAARKKWCILIVLLVVLAIVIVVGLVAVVVVVGGGLGAGLPLSGIVGGSSSSGKSGGSTTTTTTSTSANVTASITTARNYNGPAPSPAFFAGAGAALVGAITTPPARTESLPLFDAASLQQAAAAAAAASALPTLSRLAPRTPYAPFPFRSDDAAAAATPRREGVISDAAK